MRMLKLIIGRAMTGAIVVFGVSCMVFMLIHVVPGDPVEVMLGESASAVDRTVLRKELGLDAPILTQWIRYTTDLSQLDLGRSLHSRRPISALLAERVPWTLYLAVCALCVALIIAIPLGVVAALRVGTMWDTVASTFSLLGVSIPNFVLGPVLIIVFAVWLKWLPVSGNDGPLGIILPAITLGASLAAILARMVRAALLEVLSEEYITAARARGLSERAVIGRHAMKNAALPLLTVVGLQLGALLGGAVITEIIFSWPGIGQLTVEAIQRRDYPVVQGCVLLISCSYVGINMVTDIAYAWLDPRIEVE